MTTRVAPDAAARFRLVVYAVSAFSAVAGVIAVVSVLRAGDRTRQFGWFADGDPGAFALVVDPKGPAASVLHTGDILVALNGDRHVQWWSPQNARQFIRADDGYTITVRRDGQELTFELKPEPGHSPEQAGLARSLVFDGAVWCIVATMIALFRSDLAIARSAYAAGMAMGLFFFRQSITPAIPWVPPWLILVRQAIFPLGLMHMAIGFDFYVRFPRNAPPPAFLRWLRAAVYASCAGSALVIGLAELVLLALGQDRYSAGRAALAPIDPLIGWTAGLTQVTVGLGILATLAYNFRRIDRDDDRRRIRWVVWGTVIGLLPFAVINTSLMLAEFLPTPALRGNWYLFGNVATVAIPLSFGYAIIKHQIFDISFVIRRGLQYLLAKQALRALIFLPIAALALRNRRPSRPADRAPAVRQLALPLPDRRRGRRSLVPDAADAVGRSPLLQGGVRRARRSWSNWSSTSARWTPRRAWPNS